MAVMRYFLERQKFYSHAMSRLACGCGLDYF